MFGVRAPSKIEIWILGMIIEDDLPELQSGKVKKYNMTHEH